MRIPISTYRLQFNSAFGFKPAKDVIRYLADLGVSDLYASPIFQARPGSQHGYDVSDPRRLNTELGTFEDFEELVGELEHLDMGWVQDIVPNHMAFDGTNSMLTDVFENGQASKYVEFFDVDWHHPDETLRGRMLAPFLGRFYGESLNNGEIQLGYNMAGFHILYCNLCFPLKLESYVNILTPCLSRLKQRLGGDHSDLIRLLGVFYILKNLPLSETMEERYEQIGFVKRMLWELYSTNRDIHESIDERLKNINGIKGHPESFRALDELHSEQLFRLSFWKVATEEINYRRFFTINDLISLRIQDEKVFRETHGLIFELIESRKITGVRIDHIDGLYDPTEYLNRLREKADNVYLIVEKILDPEEDLPAFWPVQGTTGYDFLNAVNNLFCDRKSDKVFQKIYDQFSGFRTPYEELVIEKKRRFIEHYMTGDVDNLARVLKRASGKDPHGSDFTLYGFKRAITEVMACFPIYRTYMSISGEESREDDQLTIKAAAEKALEHNPGLLYELNFLERSLLLQYQDYLTEEDKEQWIHFVMRFQQLTGPLMAKGVEDTTFYVYNRLLSLNEVGGTPKRFGTTLEEWHEFNRKRAITWPYTMSATATHDTKRGEDIRARINVLSEIPEDFKRQLRQWSNLNRLKKHLVKGRRVPDRNEEYFLYQTLIGALPFSDDIGENIIIRMKGYMIKAIREAKRHTGWLKPDSDYEEAFTKFIDDILLPSDQNRFLRAFLPFQKRVAHYGILNSLSQTLLKITAPGIPDFYQGTEFWDLNLVDPDNRRPVDFKRRTGFMAEVIEREKRDIPKLIIELLSTKEDGRIKLFLIHRGLLARKAYRSVFQDGAYISIEIQGRWKNHVVAFIRNRGSEWAITVVPRLLTSLIDDGQYPVGRKVWDDTHLILPMNAPSRWRDVIADQMLTMDKNPCVGDILMHFPVALLMYEESG